MTKFGGSSIKNPVPAERLAGLWRHGGTWSLLIAEHGEGLNVLESAQCEPNDLNSRLSALCTTHGVTSVVAVVPGGQTLCRCVPIPAGSIEEMDEAAALMAETQLPETLPPFRRAGALISEAISDAGGTALITGWVGSFESGMMLSPPMVAGKTIPMSWCTVPASLAALRARSGEPAACADASDGSIGMVAEPTPGGATIARVILEDHTDAPSWETGVNAALREIGISAHRIAPDRAAVFLGERSLSVLASRVSGIKSDNDWMQAYAVPLGALLLATDARASMRSLAGLLTAAPIRDRTPVERTLEWFADDRRAWGAIAASVALLIVAPLALARVRLAILDHKAAGLVQQKSQRSELDKKAALYKQLEQSRLPMTKLLAEIAAATPQEVVATTVRLSPDQGLSMQGLAKSQEQVDQLQANLNKTGLFSDVKINRRDTKGESGVEFDVAAERVIAAFKQFAPIDDYAKNSLAKRMGIDEAELKKANEEARNNPERSGRRNGRGEDRPREDSSPRPSADELPAPVAQADIDKMDSNTAMKGWTSRRRYIQKTPSLDASTKQRLEDEIQKLRERQQKANAAGGSK